MYFGQITYFFGSIEKMLGYAVICVKRPSSSLCRLRRFKIVYFTLHYISTYFCIHFILNVD